jgi:hypothetical protein
VGGVQTPRQLLQTVENGKHNDECRRPESKTDNRNNRQNIDEVTFVLCQKISFSENQRG